MAMAKPAKRKVRRPISRVSKLVTVRTIANRGESSSDFLRLCLSDGLLGNNPLQIVVAPASRNRKGKSKSATSCVESPLVSRGRAAGTLHSAYGVGMLLASGIWLLLNPLGPSSWRYMFVIGILPAFLLLYVRRWVDEPTLWVSANCG